MISGPAGESNGSSLVWLSLSTASYCLDDFEENGDLKPVILVCHESLLQELKKVEASCIVSQNTKHVHSLVCKISYADYNDEGLIFWISGITKILYSRYYCVKC